MDIIAAIDQATGCQQCAGPLGDSPSADFCSPECQIAWTSARTVPLAHYDEPDDLPAHVVNLVELHNPETCVTCTDRTPSAHRDAPDALLALVYAHSAARRPRAPRPTPSVTPFADALRATLDRAVTRPGRSWEASTATSPQADLANFRRRWMLGFDGASDAPPVLHTIDTGQVYIAAPGTPPESDGWRAIGTMPAQPALTSTAPDSVSELRRLIETHINERMNETVFALTRPVEVTFEAAQVNWDAIRRYYLGESEEPREQAAPADPRERALWLRRHRNTGPEQRQRPPRTVNARRRR